MGVPQVSSGSVAEEVASSLSTFVQNPPRIHGVTSCDLSGLYGGNVAYRMPVDFPCFSLGGFQQKSITEVAKEREVLNSNKDGRSNSHLLKVSSLEQNCWITRKSGQIVPTPVSRIVGFDSSVLSSPQNLVDGDQHSSSAITIMTASDVTEANGLLARKRLLSPLKGVPLQDQFIDDLDIGSGVRKSDSSRNASSLSLNVRVQQENKKAHIGDSDFVSSPVWSASSSPDDTCGLNSIFFTDGPVYENKDQQTKDHSVSSPRILRSEETTLKSRTLAITIPQKKAVSSPLSLSPLGPKFHQRMKPGQTNNDTATEIEDDIITLKDVEHSLNGTLAGSFSSWNDCSFKLPNESPEEHDILQKVDLFNGVGIEKHFGQRFGCTPPQGLRSIRTLSGLSVRRSLVGSFEESLLSGRLLSTKLSQVGVFIFNL